MLPALSVLIELQALDSAIDAARKRLAEIPALEKAGSQHVTAATAALEVAKTAANDSAAARKLVEKDVAAIDTRLAKFEDHKAAVKTNDEFHALQREMVVSQEQKGALEEKVLEFMMEADVLAAKVKDAEGVLAGAKKELEAMRATHATEKSGLEAKVAELVAERTRVATGLDKSTFSKYEQLLKGRRGVAIARMEGELCTACHIAMRPAVAARVRKNEELLTCDNCQRILYYVPPPAAPAPDASSPDPGPVPSAS
jgi:predicted  nucleic acid-binding Zn-ribbon protein